MEKRKPGRPKRVTKPYSISLVLGQTKYEGTGETILEALEALDTPQKITSKGVLTVEGNGKKFERLFYVPQLKRLFWPAFKHIQAKNLSLAMK